jgi:small subunit ribosomal protein S20
VANLKSSKKRIRSNERKRVQNVTVKSSVRTIIKKVEQAIEQGNAQLAEERLSEASSSLDSAATKGAIRKNTSSRNKSRLAKKINAIKSAA